jgi:uncharacterized phiE125 gp8 family phage protein
MSYSISSIDSTSLPDAMLDMAKKHMRVDFADDDDSITEYIAWSIGYLENVWGLQVFSGEVTFMPDGGTATVQCPVQPVSPTFTAADAGGDVTADYVLRTTSLAAPVWLARADGGVIPAGVTFTMAAGYEDPADMHPSVRGNILRVAATMYEHRESITTLTLDHVPYWLNDMVSGLWVPRC